LHCLLEPPANRNSPFENQLR